MQILDIKSSIKKSVEKSNKLFVLIGCFLLLISNISYSQLLSSRDSINFKHDFDKLLAKYGLKSDGYFINVKSTSQSGGQTAGILFNINNNYANSETTPADLEVSLEGKQVFWDSTYTNESELCLQVLVDNYGQEKATKIKDSSFIIREFGGRYFLSPCPIITIQETNTDVQPNTTRRSTIFIPKKKLYNFSGCFLVFYIHYTDRKGSIGLLKNIVDISNMQYNTTLRSPDSNKYAELITYLKTKDRW
ncbi:MAG TPA: hypothetical protein VK559_08605 [Ferruginibacter sp.]|nr:hypothetical protein [Ferruginibacter sp.]